MTDNGRLTVISVVSASIALVLALIFVKNSDLWDVISIDLFPGVVSSALVSLFTVLIVMFLRPENIRRETTSKELKKNIDRLNKKEEVLNNKIFISLQTTQKQISDLQDLIVRSERQYPSLATFQEIGFTGLKKIFNYYPTEEIEADIENAKQTIVILHTWFSISVKVATRIEKIYRRQHHLVPEVNILLLSPKSFYSKARSVESNLGDPCETGQRTVRCLHDFLPLMQSSNEKFKIKIYNSTPAVALFQIDNRIYYTPLLLGMTCHEHSWYMVEFEGELNDRTPKIVKDLIKHIHLMDQKSKIVDDRTLSELKSYMNQQTT